MENYTQKIEKIAEEITNNEIIILNNLDQESIRVYEYLQKEFNREETKITSNFVFQFVFRSYYRLDTAGLTKDCKEEYFKLMKNKESLANILFKLYDYPTLRKKNTIQFSFATKLLHTLNNTEPIFDSQVSKITGLKIAGSKKTKEERIKSSIEVYEKLKRITKGLLDNNEIKGIIKRFKEKFNTNISNMKVLDFLLWSFGSIKKNENRKNLLV